MVNIVSKRGRVLLFLMLVVWGAAACQPNAEDQTGSSAPTLPVEATVTGIPTSTKVPESPATAAPSPTSTLMPTPQAPLSGVEINRVGAGGYVGTLLQGNLTSWVRHNGLLWSRVEPIPGERKWEALADLEFSMRQINESGSELILIIRDTPDWAQKVPGYSCGPIAEEDFAAFGDFMFDVVQRYSQEPYGVKYWELGNEPDVDTTSLPNPRSIYGCWGDRDLPFYGGGYYAEMLKVVYPRIKQGDANAQVLIGGLLLDCDPTNPPETQAGSGQYKDCSSSTFLEGVLQNGGGSYLDAISFHAYDYYFGSLGKYGNGNWGLSYQNGGPALIAKVKYLRSLLLNYGYPDLPLLNTEVAVLCGSSGKEEICLTGDYETTKAYYIAQAYAAARTEGLAANIWYSDLGWRGSAVLDRDGATGAVWQAFLTSSSILQDAVPAGAIAEGGVIGYAFAAKDQYIQLVWSKDGETYPLELGTMPNKILDVYGVEQELSQSLTISFSPLYIFSSK